MALFKNVIFIAPLLVTLPLAVFAAGAIDINTASLKELDTLVGIGPVLAQRIIDGRPYYSIDDLLEVKGIGPATLHKIKEQGLAYVSKEMSSQAPQKQPTPTAVRETPLPKPEKSDTKQSIPVTPAALQDSPIHPAWFFVAILGLIIIAGAGYLIWKFKLYVRP